MRMHGCSCERAHGTNTNAQLAYSMCGKFREVRYERISMRFRYRRTAGEEAVEDFLLCRVRIADQAMRS